MSAKTISQFMWGYQPHFRIQYQSLMNRVLEALGIPDSKAECVLIGVKIPNRSNPNDLCLEPEDGKWSMYILDGLLDRIEKEITNHPLRNVLYSDEPSMRDKPERIRRDAIRISIQKAMKAYDADNGVRSFPGTPAPVDDHYVAPILQIPNALFERFRPLREPVTDGQFTGHASLIHAAVEEVLTEANDELLRPEPGRQFAGRSLWPDEIGRRAASSFMYTPRIAIRDEHFGSANLFERFNVISSLMYEGTKGLGRLLLAKPEDGAVEFLLKFAEPVPFREHRWSRKVLQLASSENLLIADCEKIYGLGNIASGIDPWTSQSVFEIEFLDHCFWRLSCGGNVMLVSEYGAPSLPQEAFPKDRLLDTYRRLFPTAHEDDVDRFSALFGTAVEQRHGSMLVVASDAEPEANRLQGQGTRIKPMKLTPDLYRQVSGIDGTVVIDPHGICHAIGVILDGPAGSECTPSRGARYNSGIRYVSSSNAPRLAVIVSDDQTVDVIPVLRPRVKRSVLELKIAELEAVAPEEEHSPLRWLSQHRFYLTQEQCSRINNVLERIRNEPMEVGEIRIKWMEFSPDPNCNESYFEDEEAT